MRLSERARSLKITLWTLIVPPTVWAAHFLLCYILAATMCAKGAFDLSFRGYGWIVAAATLIALILVAGTGIIARWQEKIADDPPPHDRGTEEARLRFLAKSTELLAGLSFIAILFTALPVIFLQDCR